jgi:hypothetical protein
MKNEWEQDITHDVVSFYWHLDRGDETGAALIAADIQLYDTPETDELAERLAGELSWRARVALGYEDTSDQLREELHFI